LISRASGDRERLVALAEAARCLTMLERDLGKASSLLVEASAISERIGVEAIAVPIAEGLIHEHEGRYAHASRFFLHALEIARRDRDRENEFSALEHLVTLRMDEGNYVEANALTVQLVEIGEKLREGSDAPFARVLRALGAYANEMGSASELDRALAELEACDAKHRLAFSLSRGAGMDLTHGRIDMAERRASAALRFAEILGRPSEIALSHCMLGRVMIARGDLDRAREYAAALSGLDGPNLSSHARAAIGSLIEELGSGKDGTSHGNSGRRKNVRTTR
jgi:tetratricopeptide (TPR) repeat protein